MIVDPIKQHVIFGKVANDEPLVNILVEAKLISELNLLYNDQLINLDEVALIIEKHGLASDNIEFINYH
jgi:hypothetical protein